MKATDPRILVVDDDQDAASMLRDALDHRGFVADATLSAAECLDHMRRSPSEIVITDLVMEGVSGIELCEALRQEWPHCIIIVVTGSGSVDNAIAAVRAGANDFLVKPVKADVLTAAVARAVEQVRLRNELRRLRDVTARPRAPWGIAGASKATRDLVAMIDRIADSDAPVLIQGESGTGKELVARALHERSGRTSQPFIAVNCAAMPAPLLESELFGHTRGAFTDAKQARTGLLVQAGAGTIFLDELGELPTVLQPKLLRALQERRVRPVGADHEVPIQARILTATNRDLEREVKERRFREDLFYRVNVVSIAVPPLRERSDDILLLAHFFLEKIAQRAGKPMRGITLPAARVLVAYDWPGNIRELENCIERAVALCRLDEITVDDLPQALTDRPESIIVSADPSELVTLDEMARRYTRRVLEATRGNKAQAARVLGIDRRSIYRRLAAPAPDQG